MVPSITDDAEPPPWWNELDLENNSLQIPLDKENSALLDTDWLSTKELEEWSRQEIRDKQLCREIIQSLSDSINTTVITPAKSLLFSSEDLQSPSASPQLRIQPITRSAD